MSEATDGYIDTRAVGGDDLRHAPRRARPVPLPSAARLAADRHSRRVRLLKIVLPSAAVAIALGIVGLTWVQSRLQGAIDVKTVLFSKDGLTMVEPHLSGHAEGRSYDVSAQRAVQSIENPKLIGLEGIDGRIEMADGSWAKIESAKGTYDGTREWLTLDGAVSVTTSTGWQAKSEHAEADLSNGRIVTDSAVRITGRNGMIDAVGLDVSEGGHRILFRSDVRMTFQPGGEPDAAAASPPAPETRP
jgi:lipopolysaccharide export system protein LptC